MLSRATIASRQDTVLRSPLSVPFRFAGTLLPALRAYGGYLGTDPGRNEPPRSLGRLGALEVRLARSAAEIRRAQKLRFDVFYREKSAVAAAAYLARRDVDLFDAACDHLLVLDHAAAGAGKSPTVVGTCRLLRQDVAERTGGFYSAGEFDVGALLARRRDLRFLELGRSCVLPPYRTKRTVELLWHGIWSYVLEHRSDVMIGCASLEGTDPDRLALPLAFLHHYARAPEPWRTSALPRRYVELNRMPKAAVSPKAALALLPPLIKGYLRLGAVDRSLQESSSARNDPAMKWRPLDHTHPGFCFHLPRVGKVGLSSNQIMVGPARIGCIGDCVSELFFTGLLIGVIVAAPIGPVGTATLLEMASGHRRHALAGMAGCIVAELVLLLIAVFSTDQLSAYLMSLPKIVPISVGMAMLAIGIYYLAATIMPRFGSITTFMFAFKITLLTPNNLAALIALMVAMGVAVKLNSFAHDAAFMIGEFLGVVLCWMGLLWLGWRAPQSPRMQKAVPLLRRGVGAVMIITGTIIVTRQIFAT